MNLCLQTQVLVSLCFCC